MAYTHQDAWDLAQRLRQNLKLQNAISFADMPYPAPAIDYFPDDTSYFNFDANMIHIGVHGIVDMFGIDSDELFKNGSDYVQEHEEQHRRSTAARPYGWGIERGCQIILEYISSKEDKTKRRFKSDRDYEYYANNILPQMGIRIHYGMLSKIVAGIMNSLEDGRIERIRSNRRPGFEQLRKYFRFRFWDGINEKFPPYESIKDNAAEKLRIISNQVLTLATCQLYQKGFVLAYVGTPLMDEVNSIKPFVTKAYISGTTRGMVMQGLEIVKALAPYIYETCKMAEIDPQVRKLLEELIKSMIESLIDGTPDTGLSESDEDTDDGSLNTSFGISDLVIEVDEETFEKLKNNTRNKEGEGGIKIRKKGEDSEKSDDSDQDASPGGNGSGDSPKDDGSNKDGKSGTGQQEESSEGSTADTGNEGGRQNAGDGTQESAEGEGADGATSGDTSEGGSEAGEAGEAMTSMDEPMETASSQTGSSEDKSSGNNRAAKKSDEVAASQEAFEEELRKEAEAAKEEMIDNALSDLETINQTKAHENSRGAAKNVPDKDDPVRSEDVKAMLPEDVPFKELKRDFKLDQNLPPVIRERGRTLKRNNDKYFKSLSRPTVTHRESGSIDPGRIYGLAMGETDIFRKTGKDRKFDGCAYVLIDHSGSMQGDKHQAACSAAAIIEEGFRGIMPMKIVSFNWRGGVVHEVVKGWEEQQNKNCCWNYYVHSCPNGGNEDGYDIRIVTSELLKRPERRKLLVVLSDGAPGNRMYTREAIAKARRHGVQVAGIYFEEGEPDAEAFADMYQKDYVICSPAEIVKHLTAICKRFSRS